MESPIIANTGSKSNLASETEPRKKTEEKVGIVGSSNSHDPNVHIEAQTDKFKMPHKKTENKIKYRKLRHKLNNLCSQSLQNRQTDHDPSLFNHKSTILKLCTEFYSRVGQHNKDYHLIEEKLKEILKTLSKQPSEDVSLMKYSKFVGGFSVLLKQASTFNKTDFIRSEKSLQIGMKILRIFCIVSSNCQYLISNNQLIHLNTFLVTLFTQCSHRLAVSCLEVLHSLLFSATTYSLKNLGQIEPIISLTIQIVLMGQVIDKVKWAVQQYACDQTNEQLIIKSLKYVCLVEEIHFQNQLSQQLYKQGQLSHMGKINSEAMIEFIYTLLPMVLLDQDQDLKFSCLPVCVIDMTLYCLKILVINLHLNIGFAQQLISMEKSDRFTISIKKIFYYVKYQIEEGEYIHQQKGICSEIIKIIGKIGYDNELIKKNLRESGILSLLFNHPLIYLMDEHLKNILIPSICSTLDRSLQNLQLYLSENSSDCLVTYISDCINSSHKNLATRDRNEYSTRENNSKYANQLKLVQNNVQENVQVKTTTIRGLNLSQKGTKSTDKYYWLLEVLPLARWSILMNSLINMDK